MPVLVGVVLERKNMVLAPNVFVRAIVLQLQDLIVVLSAGGLRQQKQEKEQHQRARPDILRPEGGRGIGSERWNEKKREKGSVSVRQRRARARERDVLFENQHVFLSILFFLFFSHERLTR